MLMVSQIVNIIMASVTSTSITYARCVKLNVYAKCDFLLPISVILASNHKCSWLMLM